MVKTKLACNTPPVMRLQQARDRAVGHERPPVLQQQGVTARDKLHI